MSVLSRVAIVRSGTAFATICLLGAVAVETHRRSSSETAAESRSVSTATTTTLSADASSTTVASTAPNTTEPPVTTTLAPRAEPGLLLATGRGPLDGRLVVVDPGHNGLNFQYGDAYREDSPYLCNSTGSTATNGVPEYEINWAIGQALTVMLNRLGANVLLTHEDNEGFGPCADERGALARDNPSAALISIHADGSTTGGSGIHIIHPAAHPNLSAESVAQSKVLALLTRDELLAVGARPSNYVGTNGTHQRDDLANLNTANRPAILVELGNIRNPIDARLLTEKPSQQVIAAALARALLRFFGLPTDSPLVRGDVNGDLFPDPLPDYSTTTTTTTTLPLPEASEPVAPPAPVEQVPTTGVTVAQP